ncbi:hypothetical protein F5Y03DRAFT_192899 [Xylaria venustula]|nr:hypothetical protein F5Y03DRAFT_192899 [Xylaria venustula]
MLWLLLNVVIAFRRCTTGRPHDVPQRQPNNIFNAPDGKLLLAIRNIKATPKYGLLKSPRTEKTSLVIHAKRQYNVMPHEENREIHVELAQSDAIVSTGMQYVVQWYLQRDGQYISVGMSAKEKREIERWHENACKENAW